MNDVFIRFVSMSFSGAVLILALFVGKRFWRDKISRQWQYYIWLVVILRLLLPFAPEQNLMRTAGQALSSATRAVQPQFSSDTGNMDSPAAGLAHGGENTDNLALDNKNGDRINSLQMDVGIFKDTIVLLGSHIWAVWLAAAAGLMVRKITMYQGFVRYIRAGSVPVNDIAMLEKLSDAAAQTGIRRPVELCVNPLVSSPMLTGFFRPCIVLPSVEIAGKDFYFIALHELMHHKRLDILYKWLVQITVCLHWFNPMVYWMSREITRACEFSCDAAVLAKVGTAQAPDYGKTLLDAMAAVRTYRESFGVVTLSENKQLLKERLVAVMNIRKKSKAAVVLTGMLTLFLIFGAAFVGVYPAAAKNSFPENEGKGVSASPAAAKNSFPEKEDKGASASQAEQYYEAGSFPMFLIVFSQLDEEAKGAWLDRIYADGQFAFLSAVVNQLEVDSAHIQQIAEKAYADDSVIFFSIVANRMSEKTLKTWLDRAQADGKFAFQSMLFGLLDDDELDAREEELEKQLAAAQVQEYLEHGIVSDENLKTFYYKSQLVHIFLDIKKEKSFYFLQVNPKGTVNVKVTRDENNHIKSVDYMTDAEVTALFGDMKEEDEDDYETSAYDVPQMISVNEQRIAAGAKLWFGDYDLCSGDKIQYNIEAETGNAIMVGFVNNADGGLSETTYCSVLVHREDGVLKCTADFVCGEPVKDGLYKLCIYAPEGALGNVKGNVLIAHAR